MKTKKDIPAGSLLIELPISLIVNRKIILASNLGPLIKKHPDIFNKHNEVDQSLVIFAFHERLKGEKSFWFPAFDIVNISRLPAFWTDKEISEFQD